MLRILITRYRNIGLYSIDLTRNDNSVAALFPSGVHYVCRKRRQVRGEKFTVYVTSNLRLCPIMEPETENSAIDYRATGTREERPGETAIA